MLSRKLALLKTQLETKRFVDRSTMVIDQHTARGVMKPSALYEAPFGRATGVATARAIGIEAQQG